MSQVAVIFEKYIPAVDMVVHKRAYFARMGESSFEIGYAPVPVRPLWAEIPKSPARGAEGGKSSALRESHSIEADTTRSGEMPIYSYLLTLFVLGTLSVTLDQDVKLCGQVSLGTEELCFAAVLVYTILTRK